jgi:RND family efflux transporter MFP subunit
MRSPAQPQTPRVALLWTLALATAALSACDRGPASGAKGRAGGEAARDAVEVSVGDVVRRPVERTVEVTGTLYGEEESVVSAKVSGRVAEVSADIGDRVKQDSLLAQIEPRDYQLALDQSRALGSASLAKLGLSSIPDDSFDPETLPTVQKARAEAGNAEAKFERAKRLFEQSPPLLSEQDFADIRTAWEVARNQADVEMLSARAILADARAQAAAVAVAQQRVTDTLIRVPTVDTRPNLVYRVAERLVSIGEYVTEGRPLFRLVSTDILEFRAQVPERYSGQVQTGQVARVLTESAEAVEGHVTRVSPSVDPQSRTFMVEIQIENAEQRLKPGGFGRAQIVLRTDADALFVPRSALVSFAGINRVYSVKDAKAVEHRVTPGVTLDTLVEIASPLDVTSVVTRNAAGLAAGTPVTITTPKGASGG